MVFLAYEGIGKKRETLLFSYTFLCVYVFLLYLGLYLYTEWLKGKWKAGDGGARVGVYYEGILPH